MSNNSMSVGGVDLGSSTYNLMVLQATHQLMADSRVSMSSKGARNGAESQGETLDPIFLTLLCRIEGNDSGVDSDKVADVVRRADLVKKIFRKGLQIYKLDRDVFSVADLDREYSARPNGPLFRFSKGTHVINFNLNLVVPEGLAQNTSDVTQSITITTTPQTLTVPASGSVVGTSLALPVWVITNTNAAAVTQVTFASTHTIDGESAVRSMVWKGSLAQNDKLRIDSVRQHIEKSTDGGTTYTNAISGLTAGDPFVLLVDGISNSLTLTGVTDGSVGITYRAKFV